MFSDSASTEITYKEIFNDPLYTQKTFNTQNNFFNKNDPQVPAALFSAVSKTPDLSKFPYPLPSAKSEYTCSAEGDN